MALVHECLYGSHDLASIELSSYVQDIVGHLVGLYEDRFMESFWMSR